MGCWQGDGASFCFTRLQEGGRESNRGYVVMAERSSDTPVAYRPANGLITPNLFKPQPSPAPCWWGFSVPALFSQDQRWRNYLQLCLLSVCFSKGICSRSRLPRPAPLAGEFLFQDAAPAMASDAIVSKIRVIAGLGGDCWITVSTRQSSDAGTGRMRMVPGRRNTARDTRRNTNAIRIVTRWNYLSDEVGATAFVQTSIRYQPFHW